MKQKAKKRRPRILAFTPTFGEGPRAETLASVAGQVFDGEIVHELSWLNPFPAPDYRNVKVQYERGWQMALEGDFDALCTVEHDMWAPPDAMQKLWDALQGAGDRERPGVAYGVYLFRHGAGMLSSWGWQPGLVGPGLAPLGQPLSGSKLALARAAEVTRVSGVGFGWTLISRATLEQIPLRLDPSEDWAPDVPFALDCMAANVLQVAHFGVLCGHWDGDRWRGPLGCQVVDGVWVREKRNMVTIIAGEKLELIAGNEYAVPAADVRMLERREFAERIPGR